MSILNFISKLLPTFSRNKITESCELTISSIREHSLPAYQTAEDLFKGQKFKSEEAQELVKVFQRHVGKLQGNTIIGSVKFALENSIVILKTISDDSKDIYAETEANLALTYVKATYLRLIDAAAFADAYSLKFLNYLLVLETAEADKHVSLKDSMTPAEIEAVKSGLLDFCLTIEILSRDVKETQRLIKGVPDALITTLTEKTFPSTLGMGKIDPLRMNGLSARFNPFHFAGMFIAEYQANKYKASKTTLELVQLRKLNLEKIYDKTQDAGLQKEIEYMENRVSKLNYSIAQMEKEYMNG